MGIWKDWLESTSPACEKLWNVQFSTGPFYLSALENRRSLLVSPTLCFSASGHHPILAGINDAGEKEYVVEAYFEVEEHAIPDHVVGTITEGSRTGYYMDDDGSRKVKRPEAVPVLRFDPCPAFLNVVKMEKGLDATGPFYWKDATGDESNVYVPERLRTVD